MQNDIFKYRGITIEVPDTRAIVDGEFVVSVRKKLGMGQKPFARILGITERTLNRGNMRRYLLVTQVAGFYIC